MISQDTDVNFLKQISHLIMPLCMYSKFDNVSIPNISRNMFFLYILSYF